MVSRMLEPDEREVVWGDIAEAGESGGEALCDLLGLVARRQAGLWKAWRPWLALAVVPLGMRLGERAALLGRSYDLNLWILTNYREIDRAILRESGIAVSSGVAGLLLGSLVLAGLAWALGFVLGLLARQTAPVSGGLFCLLALAGTVLAMPRSNYYVNGEVYRVATGYTMLLPLTLMSVLVLVPALSGLLRRRGSL